MPSASLPWRDLPREYGLWHTIYMRFKRRSENGLLCKILYELKQKKLVRMDIVFMDSTTARRIGADVGRCGKKGEEQGGTRRERERRSMSLWEKSVRFGCPFQVRTGVIRG
jgi:hypothetical protein